MRGMRICLKITHESKGAGKKISPPNECPSAYGPLTAAVAATTATTAPSAAATAAAVIIRYWCILLLLRPKQRGGGRGGGKTEIYVSPCY